MNVVPSKFILSIKPKEYLKQGLSHCGAYSVKGILSAYGKDKKAHPTDYHPHLFGRLTGITTGPKYWPSTLSKHGIKATLQSAKSLNNEDKLSLLRHLLSEDNPVMVAIGNGYLPNGRYNSLLGRIIGHWITIWGYNDNDEIFYVYDSCVPIERHNKEIPIGNTTRTYQEMLRDWKVGFTLWVRWIGSYSYIKVQPTT